MKPYGAGMFDLDTEKVLATYEKDGCVASIRLILEQDAMRHRGFLEEAETFFGNLHYRSKSTLFIRRH